MSEEIWKPITGFSNYEISSLGRVKTTRYRGTDKEWFHTGIYHNGYHVVLMTNDDNIRKYKKVHKLMAEAFIPNPENKSTIDHINRNKLDNSISNLRWATSSEQNSNQAKKLSNTGYKHICLTSNGTYRFNPTQKRFKSLEEAITFRDETLRTALHPGCS